VFLVSFGLVFGFVSFVSDLLAFFHWFKTWPSATGSSASLGSAGGLRLHHCHLDVGVCLPRARELQNSNDAWCIRMLHPLSHASFPGEPWWNWWFPLLRCCPWAARVYHAPLRTAPNHHPPNSLLLLLFFIFLGLCFVSFSPCLPLFFFGLMSLWLNTPMKLPSMMTPALWHPCLESKGPHLWKHCPSVLSFIVSILGCPGPPVFVFFFVIGYCCTYNKK